MSVLQSNQPQILALSGSLYIIMLMTLYVSLVQWKAFNSSPEGEAGDTAPPHTYTHSHRALAWCTELTEEAARLEPGQVSQIHFSQSLVWTCLVWQTPGNCILLWADTMPTKASGVLPLWLKIWGEVNYLHHLTAQYLHKEIEETTGKATWQRTRGH